MALKQAFLLLTAAALTGAQTPSPANRQPGATTRPAAGKYRVGFRVFNWSYRAEDGSQKQLATAVWYPAASGEPGRHEYLPDLTGRAVRDATPAAGDEPFPLILYSHGFGGGAIAAVYLCESLASHGYVVAAPDHNDPVSVLRITGRTGADAKKLFVALVELADAGRRQRDEKYSYRPKELRLVIDKSLAQNSSPGSPLRRLIDPDRIGCCGHSMGGFTCLALAGCSPAHADGRIKAVVLHSPVAFMWDTTNTGRSACRRYTCTASGKERKARRRSET